MTCLQGVESIRIVLRLPPDCCQHPSSAMGLPQAEQWVMPTWCHMGHSTSGPGGMMGSCPRCHSSGPSSGARFITVVVGCAHIKFFKRKQPFQLSSSDFSSSYCQLYGFAYSTCPHTLLLVKHQLRGSNWRRLSKTSFVILQSVNTTQSASPF